MRFLLFFAIVLSITVLGHAYVGARLTQPLLGRWVTFGWGIVALNWIVMVGGMVLAGTVLARSPLGPWVGLVGFFALGLWSLVLALTAGVDLVRLLVFLVDGIARLLGQPGLAGMFDPERRAFLAQAVNVTVVGGAGALALLGLKGAFRPPEVVTVEIPIDGLPPELEGFTIAQVSDIHIGSTIKGAFLEAVVRDVNALGADLIAITGDLVDGRVSTLGAEVASLASLRARHGVFFVTGNHEYYSGVHEWIDHLKALGLTVLVNAHQVVDHAGRRILVAGVTDLSAHQMVPEHRSDPVRAIDGAPACDVRVLLAHQPRSAFDVEGLGFDLQLSGHTHGGQYFPGTMLIRLVQPIAVGLHRIGRLWVYVNRGTGYWGPPFRFPDPSEITLLRLKGARS